MIDSRSAPPRSVYSLLPCATCHSEPAHHMVEVWVHLRSRKVVSLMRTSTARRQSLTDSHSMCNAALRSMPPKCSP